MRLLDDLRILAPPLPWHGPVIHSAQGDRVVLLHGLWRSYLAMEGVAREANAAGYECVNISYPSFRKPLDEIVKRVAEVLLPLERKTTHFVTHSLGGIVLRRLAADYPELVSGRVVMVAPPSQGSEIVDWLKDSPFGKAFLGPAGLSLSTERVPVEVPRFPESQEVGIIMGKTRTLPFFQQMLEEENDGIVSVERGRLKGVKNFCVVEGDHTFIVNEPEVRALVKHFLQNGKFD